MATYLSQISRCLSYHAPICRPHRLLHGSCKQWKKICTSCVCWQPPLLMEIQPQLSMRVHVQLFSTKTTNVFTFNSTSDMLRKRISFTGTKGENAEAAANIVPVGLIVPEKGDNTNMKIVIVPLDLANQDSESLKNTLNVINELRNHAREIDLFTNSILEDYRKNESEMQETAAVEEQEKAINKDDIHLWDTYTAKEVDAVSSAKTHDTNAREMELQAAVASLANDFALSTQADVAPMIPSPGTPNMPSAPSTFPINPNTAPSSPQTQPGVLPLADPMEPQISARPQNEAAPPEAVADIELELEPEFETQGHSEVQQFTIDVPAELGQHLSEMAISSMHLSFEMNMTNVLDAILHGDQAEVMGSSDMNNNPLVFLETNVKVDPANEAEATVPLKFNAFIQGTVDIDADKLNPEQLTQDNLPNYNDAVTTMAANICSTALQQGFATDQLTSSADRHTPLKSSPQARMALKRHQAQKHMKVEHSRPQSVYAAVAEPNLKDGCKNPVVKKKKKCGKPCKLDDPCKEDKCNRPHKEKKSPTKITKKPKNSAEITASAAKSGGKSKCGKGKGDKAKKDGKGAKGGKDGGDKKDPCAKFKKAGKSGKDGKGGDGKDKKDPCAKFKKGKDGKGKDGKDKKNACAKGKDGKDGKGKDGQDKKDPCAKFKKGKDGKVGKGAKGKEVHDIKDPCAKFKKGKAGKSAKGKDCAKFKKEKAAKDGKGAKGKEVHDIKDPCAKFKKAKAGKDGKGAKGKEVHDIKDPCAKFKKGKAVKSAKGKDCAKFRKGKDGKGKKGAKGADKKNNPCAKLKKGKDGKGKKCAKGAGKKNDPCGKFKKGGKGKKGAKDAKSNKKNPCQKKYSTFTSPVSKFYHASNTIWNPKRKLSTALNNYAKIFREQARSNPDKSSNCDLRAKPARFTVYSTLVRRHYGGQPSVAQMKAWGFKSWMPLSQLNRTWSSKDENKKSKCSALQQRRPKRKTSKRRSGLRTDCYGTSGEDCAKASCKSKCDQVKFPRKKCEKKKNKKPKMALKARKPKKKMPSICKQGRKGKKSRDGKGRKK